MAEQLQFFDLCRKLEQLNRLEIENSMSRKPDSAAAIESLRASIPSNALLHHDRLRARGRQSIAAVRNDVCSGCHMKLPISTLTDLKRASTLMKCDFCGRYVFLGEGPADVTVREIAKKRSRIS